MDLQGDSTAFLAAIVATVIALAVFGIGRVGIAAEERRGSTPLWVYAFGVMVPLAALVLAGAAQVSAFAAYLTMILAGMFAGACVAYYGFRVLLLVWARWQGGPRDT